MSLPSRKVPVQSLGQDKMSCLRVAINNVPSQVTVNIILNTHNNAAENNIGSRSIATLLSGDQQFGNVTMSPNQNSRNLW